MTMDRNGVNEMLDDDYSNTTCDCRFCKEKKLKQTFTSDYDDFDFDLVWDETQKPEPPEFDEALMFLNSYPKKECTCEECHCCDQDMLVDFAEEMEEDQIIEVISGDLEDAFISVLYSLQTGQPRQDLVEKIVYLEELLDTLKFIPVK
jgi:hypothetical protein